MVMYCLVIASVIIEENHKRDFLQQYRSNLQFCRAQKGCSWRPREITLQIYSHLSGGFKKFRKILLPNGGAAHCASEGLSEAAGVDSCDCPDCRSELILYSPSNQAPRSRSLQRCEQKGKNSACLGGSRDGASTGLPQIGHLCFIAGFGSAFLTLVVLLRALVPLFWHIPHSIWPRAVLQGELLISVCRCPHRCRKSLR